MTPTHRWLPTWARPPLRALRIAMVVAVDSLAFLWKRRIGDAAMVVRLDAIGDFVIWLQNGAADLALDLRRDHTRLVLVANPAWAAMARELRLWDEVLPVDPDRFLRQTRYRLDVLRTIRQLGIGKVVQPRAARLFLLEDEIARLCGAPVRIGSDAVLANITPALRARGNRAYTRIVPVPLSLEVHESFRGRAFAAALCESVGEIVSSSRLGPAPRSTDGPAEPYVVVAMGAGWSGRRWPIEKFATLLTRIHQETGLRCVAIGAQADRPLVDALRRLTPAHVNDRCGKLTLSDSARLIAGSRLVIANESGPMHIGIWCRVPVVGLVGGGHFGWFAPYPPDGLRGGNAEFLNVDMPCYHCNWNCRFEVRPGAAVPCVRDIPVELVARSAFRLLDAGAVERLDGTASCSKL